MPWPAAELVGTFNPLHATANDRTPTAICDRLLRSAAIVESLVAVIWIGSMSRTQDLHDGSDFDIQVIMERPDRDALLALGEVLRDYRSVDLSVMYLGDIVDEHGNVDFQDGTKGAFFIYVLEAGIVLYGTNVYSELLGSVQLEDVKPSLRFTIREYLARLRVMAVQGIDDAIFKKYSLKLFKDILAFTGDLSLRQMVCISNADTVTRIRSAYGFEVATDALLSTIARYGEAYTPTERVALVLEYERMVEASCRA